MLITLYPSARRRGLIRPTGYATALLAWDISPRVGGSRRPEKVAHPPPPRTLRVGRVLVVDNLPAMQAIVGRLLNGLGVGEVRYASDAAAAFRLLHHASCDLAVIDVEMERINGLQLLRAIRSHAGTTHMPVLMMTTSRNLAYVGAAVARRMPTS